MKPEQFLDSLEALMKMQADPGSMAKAYLSQSAFAQALNAAKASGDKNWENALRLAAFTVQDAFVALCQNRPIIQKSWAGLIANILDMEKDPDIFDRALDLCKKDKEAFGNFIREKAGLPPKA